ncbi:seven transmembrane protein 1 [Myriangium duriaei CBS 260.36]|uniref:Seven transmembrane protein 1 n=1 Tax=Myriangium duriaei CBS 260.36 TaxID=1168546 RepID=A0A9P4MHU5_9PEZI|nr:seven transmembrane protein 1 [Myriangium duriaei CBS 260.36]
MFPPPQGYSLDVEAISGICGSVSIACWVVVFSPQIIENFRRSSAEGLSVEFIVIWLLGDFANIIGAVLQKVLPTMIILAIYYTLADIVLLAQCFYYRGFTLRDPKPVPKISVEAPNERAPLLTNDVRPVSPDTKKSRSSSAASFGEHFHTLGEHFSPVTPVHTHPKSEPPRPASPRPLWKTIVFNLTAIVVVVIAGIAGYYLSPAQNNQDRGGHDPSEQESSLTFSTWGQIFGYLCAVLYLGSRIPQLLLNYRRKSTEGLNALFFLFACIGNLTFVLSIFAFEPICSGGKRGKHCAPGESGRIYGRYILVNLSWLLGSLGTLFLDMGVFVQFFLYRDSEEEGANRLIEEEDEQ